MLHGSEPGARSARRVATRVAAAVLLATLVYVAVTFVQVWLTSRRDEVGPAQAIVVMGAAQYNGRPSPVFQARLDHAAALYADGVAPIVTVTGGVFSGGGFSEATAADLYLQARGVPPGALRLEVDGRTSYESLAASARFLAAEGVTDVLLVSDAWHLHRAAAIAAEVGLDAGVSPPPESPYSVAGELRQLVRETFAVSLGRVIGYRRLDHLARDLGS